MIYLISKIIAYLLSALAIGFGMGWFVQYSQAKRLREQLNSVIFETKSRIPQLETTITKRDQKIEQLTMQLNEKPESASGAKDSDDAATAQHQNSASDQAKEYEAELQQLRRTVAELTTELELSNSMEESTDQPVREVDFSSGNGSFSNGDSDDFLDEIKDIFEGDDMGPRSSTGSQSSLASAADTRAAEEASHAAGYAAGLAAAQAAARAAASEGDSVSSPDDHELEQLRTECEELNAARRKLAETIDSQTRELEQVKEQTNLQDKSLNVLNQQLELSREANERIVRELKKYKADAS